MGLKEYKSIQLVEENLITLQECVDFISLNEDIDKETAFDWLFNKNFLFGDSTNFYKLNKNFDSILEPTFSNYGLTFLKHEMLGIKMSSKSFIFSEIAQYAFKRFKFYFYISMEFELLPTTRKLCFEIYHA